MTLAPIRLSEAADSLAKASTPQPWSTSRTSNWVARAGGLPDYIQHLSHGIYRSQKVKDESKAIEEAIGVCKHPPANWGAEAKAACAKAIAEWEAKKAKNAAKGAVKESWVPTLAATRAVERAALEELLLFEAAVGLDGIVALLAEGALAEAAAWTPALKRTASAANEVERHEVYDGGQHVGTIARSRAYSASEPDRHSAWAVNGTRVSGHNERSRQAALDALRKHLEEAPARVAAGPGGKHLVMTPESYGGGTSYRAFSDLGAARYAAGLPPAPTSPERDSKVEAVAEMLRWDLGVVSGLDVRPLRHVQEACRRDPFDLLEAFHADELRGLHGRWVPGGGMARMVRGVADGGGAARSAADLRYEGGVVRVSARARIAHAARPQIGLAKLKDSVGRGRWSASAEKATRDILAGRAKDTEHAHRARRPDGSLGAYTPERQALHERIIENLTQGKGSHRDPQAVFTAGGPASGKSSLEKHGHLSLPGDVVHANPDVIREMLPEYKQLADAGREDAASLTHEEASYLAKLATRHAMGRQHHLFVDGVGDSGEGKFSGKIRDAKRAGYRVSVHYATVPVDEAVRRARKRGDDMAARGETPRYVEERVIREGHQGVSRRFGEVARIPGVHLRVFDTSGAPRLLAEKTPGSDKLDIKDARGFRGFLEKAKGGGS